MGCTCDLGAARFYIMLSRNLRQKWLCDYTPKKPGTVSTQEAA